ncbi:Spo0E family sporulation regulatory protein-aspartic acid phosphatase [Sutcliffiella horikoshii]
MRAYNCSRLIQSYKENGLDSDTTINISQELDVIINMIQILKLKYKLQ